MTSRSFRRYKNLVEAAHGFNFLAEVRNCLTFSLAIHSTTLAKFDDETAGGGEDTLRRRLEIASSKSDLLPNLASTSGC
jgi:hypothetical protein